MRELYELLNAVPVAKMQRVFRSREAYAGKRARPPIAIRLDGVRFGRALSNYGLRSLEVHRALIDASMRVMEELGCCCSYVVSDEINVLCLDHIAYGGRVEKLVSISSGIASSVVSRALDRELFFDSRVIVFQSDADVVSYVLYRARVEFNNFVSQLYHRAFGGYRGTPKLSRMIEELASRGIDVFREPLWKTVGSSIAKEVRERGYGKKGWTKVVSEGFQKCIECALRRLILG